MWEQVGGAAILKLRPLSPPPPLGSDPPKSLPHPPPSTDPMGSSGGGGGCGVWDGPSPASVSPLGVVLGGHTGTPLPIFRAWQRLSAERKRPRYRCAGTVTWDRGGGQGTGPFLTHSHPELAQVGRGVGGVPGQRGAPPGWGTLGTHVPWQRVHAGVGAAVSPRWHLPVMRWLPAATRPAAAEPG